VEALRPETDVVFLRENTEGVYAGHESRLTDDVATLTRLSTRRAATRLAEFACEFVAERDLEGFTVAHKANVMRETDGLFLETVEAVADDHGVATEPVLMDAFAMQLGLTPEAYDVVVCPNLAGDVLSDQAAGLVGGLTKLAETGLRLWPATAQAAGYAGQSTIAYVGTNLSPALLSVGYIVGLNIAVLVFAGGAISWYVAIPLYSTLLLDSDPELAAELTAANDDLAVVGVNSNDASEYPEDSFEKMLEYVDRGDVRKSGPPDHPGMSPPARRGSG
jgi:hypothetical protein